MQERKGLKCHIDEMKWGKLYRNTNQSILNLRPFSNLLKSSSLFNIKEMLTNKFLPWGEKNPTTVCLDSTLLFPFNFSILQMSLDKLVILEDIR